MNISRRYSNSVPTPKKPVKQVEEVASKPEKPPSKNRRNRSKSPFSNEALKPWEDEGMSRASWYAQQRIKREREEAARIAAEEAVKLAKVRPVAKPVIEDDTW